MSTCFFLFYKKMFFRTSRLIFDPEYIYRLNYENILRLCQFLRVLITRIKECVARLLLLFNPQATTDGYVSKYLNMRILPLIN